MSIPNRYNVAAQIKTLLADNEMEKLGALEDRLRNARPAWSYNGTYGHMVEQMEFARARALEVAILTTKHAWLNAATWIEGYLATVPKEARVVVYEVKHLAGQFRSIEDADTLIGLIQSLPQVETIKGSPFLAPGRYSVHSYTQFLRERSPEEAAAEGYEVVNL